MSAASVTFACATEPAWLGQMSWIDKALATYPLETWRFEILERLPVGGMTRCAIYYADDLMRIATRART